MLSYGDELESLKLASPFTGEENLDRRLAMDRLYELIQRLRALDRQVILLYLEEESAASISEITGLSAANVATKIGRIKDVLARWFHQGVHDET